MVKNKYDVLDFNLCDDGYYTNNLLNKRSFMGFRQDLQNKENQINSSNKKILKESILLNKPLKNNNDNTNINVFGDLNNFQNSIVGDNNSFNNHANSINYSSFNQDDLNKSFSSTSQSLKHSSLVNNKNNIISKSSKLSTIKESKRELDKKELDNWLQKIYKTTLANVTIEENNFNKEYIFNMALLKKELQEVELQSKKDFKFANIHSDIKCLFGGLDYFSSKGMLNRWISGSFLKYNNNELKNFRDQVLLNGGDYDSKESIDFHNKVLSEITKSLSSFRKTDAWKGFSYETKDTGKLIDVLAKGVFVFLSTFHDILPSLSQSQIDKLFMSNNSSGVHKGLKDVFIKNIDKNQAVEVQLGLKFFSFLADNKDAFIKVFQNTEDNHLEEVYTEIVLQYFASVFDNLESNHKKDIDKVVLSKKFKAFFEKYYEYELYERVAINNSVKDIEHDNFHNLLKHVLTLQKNNSKEFEKNKVEYSNILLLGQLVYTNKFSINTTIGAQSSEKITIGKKIGNLWDNRDKLVDKAKEIKSYAQDIHNNGIQTHNLVDNYNETESFVTEFMSFLNKPTINNNDNENSYLISLDEIKQLSVILRDFGINGNLDNINDKKILDLQIIVKNKLNNILESVSINKSQEGESDKYMDDLYATNNDLFDVKKINSGDLVCGIDEGVIENQYDFIF